MEKKGEKSKEVTNPGQQNYQLKQNNKPVPKPKKVLMIPQRNRAQT